MQNDTRTVWEQTGTKPQTRFGDILPRESYKHRFAGHPAVDRWEHPDDAALHLCIDCSTSQGNTLRAGGWKRVPSWTQSA